MGKRQFRISRGDDLERLSRHIVVDSIDHALVVRVNIETFRVDGSFETVGIVRVSLDKDLLVTITNLVTAGFTVPSAQDEPEYDTQDSNRYDSDDDPQPRLGLCRLLVAVVALVVVCPWWRLPYGWSGVPSGWA